jgi:hypothetical protein
MSVFDRYRELYKTKKSTEKIMVVVDEEHELPDIPLPTASPRITVTEEPDEVRTIIRQLLDQESSIRNQREKYRMNYYKLEREKAPKEEFAKNFAIIKNLTEQLAPIYIQRKRIEQTGRVEHKREITQDEENQIRRLKYDKKRLIDKKSKLQKKIDSYMSFAKGPVMVDQWKADMEDVRLSIYDLEQQIEAIEK